MEWISIVLCIIEILSALCILYFNSKMEVKLLIFLIVLCNVGVVILGRRVVDGFWDINYKEMLDRIKDFQTSASSISASAQDELSERSKDELLNKIETLNQGIANMLTEMNNLYQSKQSVYNTDVDINNSANILQQVETVKQLQLAKLSDLQTQLNKTRQIVSSQQNAADTNKYKPIKIYSSCIVSNADGSYST
jgi:hypothetical protein